MQEFKRQNTNFFVGQENNATVRTNSSPPSTENGIVTVYEF